MEHQAPCTPIPTIPELLQVWDQIRQRVHLFPNTGNMNFFRMDQRNAIFLEWAEKRNLRLVPGYVTPAQGGGETHWTPGADQQYSVEQSQIIWVRHNSITGAAAHYEGLRRLVRCNSDPCASANQVGYRPGPLDPDLLVHENTYHRSRWTTPNPLVDTDTFPTPPPGTSDWLQDP
jgi:hypothetical protein